MGHVPFSPLNRGGSAVQITPSSLFERAQRDISSANRYRCLLFGMLPIHLGCDEGIFSLCRKNSLAAAIESASTKAHNTRVIGAPGEMTASSSPLSPSRTKSIGRSGPSCLQASLTGSIPGFHISDPQPRQAILIAQCSPAFLGVAAVRSLPPQAVTHGWSLRLARTRF